MKSYYVYILASRPDGAIYVGITSDLVKRVFEHRSKPVPSFTSRYNIAKLVWFEVYDDPLNAIAREKQLKKWRRAWKVALIARDNPEWRDKWEEICS
ncbi:GIY-YIG nuclease family protein [soil metagenome]